jgi:hypothetical protein
MTSAQSGVFAVLPIIKLYLMVRFLKCINPISCFLQHIPSNLTVVWELLLPRKKCAVRMKEIE